MEIFWLQNTMQGLDLHIATKRNMMMPLFILKSIAGTVRQCSLPRTNVSISKQPAFRSTGANSRDLLFCDPARHLLRKWDKTLKQKPWFGDSFR